MATMTIAVGNPPYGQQRVYTALRFLLVALHEGHSVNLFLFEDAVVAAKRGQKPPEMPVGDAGMPNCEEHLRAALAEGAQIKVCRVCISERGLVESELVPGIEIGSMADLVRWVVETDKAIFF